MELKFWEQVHISLTVTCLVSHVMCHMSRVTCHMSNVTCNFFCFFGESCKPVLLFWRPWQTYRAWVCTEIFALMEIMLSGSNHFQLWNHVVFHYMNSQSPITLGMKSNTVHFVYAWNSSLLSKGISRASFCTLPMVVYLRGTFGDSINYLWANILRLTNTSAPFLSYFPCN